MAAAAADLVVLEPGMDDPGLATSFGTLSEVAAAMRLRLDSADWDAAGESQRVKAAATAYRELARLGWRRPFFGRGDRPDGVSRILDFPGSDGGETRWPPVDDPEFRRLAIEAQACQAAYLLGDPTIRAMQRDGVTLSRQLKGSEIEFGGYRGAVCTEALEILQGWVETQPALRTFHPSWWS